LVLRLFRLRYYFQIVFNQSAGCLNSQLFVESEHLISRPKSRGRQIIPCQWSRVSEAPWGKMIYLIRVSNILA
jgi:hypothetical protein